MLAAQAARLAEAFVRTEAARYPGFFGAYLSGSMVELAADDVLPAGSDVDVVLVFENPAVCCHSKQDYEGILLEISPLPAHMFFDKETVLKTHYLAWAMAHGRILLDPTGTLSRRHREAVTLWQSGPYLRARRDGFLKQLADNGMRFQPDAPLQDKVTAWAFGAGIATFPVLTAAGKNCTVRRRFSAVRTVLDAYGEADFCARLTALLTGTVSCTAAQLAPHCAAYGCAGSGVSPRMCVDRAFRKLALSL